ncbi:MAG: glycosyltransferase N-terminal domain-containing protein, partial [Nonlabens sp.]
MKKLYDFVSAFAKAGLPIASLFNKKLSLGTRGRNQTWDILDQEIKSTVPKIWVHVASLGEYEQVVPVLEKLNRENYQVVLTFFSPSGYENKKDSTLVDVVCYLPLDTPDNASKFVNKVLPSLAIFVKYELWPNYLLQLQKLSCHSILISAIFRQDIIYNKWYGQWMRG